MKRIIVKQENIGAAITEAVSLLRQGCITAYPTETFYALGVRFDNEESLKKLYELKLRPKEKAVPLIIGSREMLADIASNDWIRNMPSSARMLMDRFWPGPLTLLIPAREGLSEYLTANTGMIAVRIPGESFALCLAREAGFPVTATSANLSGMQPAANADDVIKYFGGGLDLVIDDGPSSGGQPSTIVDVSGGRIRIVRHGAISKGEIDKICR